MTTANDWINVSDRLPMGPFAQVWAFWKDGSVSLSKKPATESWQTWCEVMGSALVAWQEAEIPKAPNASTQADEDYAAYLAWWAESGSTPKCDSWPSVVWALKHERAAILALTYEHGKPGASCTATLERIRERCAP